MSDLLDNELMLKYFGWEEEFYTPVDGDRRALAVLRAMQQPIAKGEKYLYIRPNPSEESTTVETSSYVIDQEWHGQYLRLPDRWQEKKERGCNCCRNHPHLEKDCHQAIHKSKPDMVEEKINEIVRSRIRIYHPGEYIPQEPLAKTIERELRELVELARGEK